LRITAENLVKTYRGRNVVNGISLNIEKGEVVGLLGPNGAGKTTTFYMIIGLIKPNAGRVFLDGREITQTPMYKRARRGIGYLAQEPSVFRRLTVEQNVSLVLEMHGVRKRERKRRTDELLEELGIAHLRRENGGILSGGERRRCEIARSLACDPSFILLDEPFSGVDPIAIGDLQDIIAQLKAKGIGIIITDHNVRETLAITDRSYIMSEGEIKTAGLSSELPNDPIAKKYYLGERFAM